MFRARNGIRALNVLLCRETGTVRLETLVAKERMEDMRRTTDCRSLKQGVLLNLVLSVLLLSTTQASDFRGGEITHFRATFLTEISKSDHSAEVYEGHIEFWRRGESVRVDCTYDHVTGTDATGKPTDLATRVCKYERKACTPEMILDRYFMDVVLNSIQRPVPKPFNALSQFHVSLAPFLLNLLDSPANALSEKTESLSDGSKRIAYDIKEPAPMEAFSRIAKRVLDPDGDVVLKEAYRRGPDGEEMDLQSKYSFVYERRNGKKLLGSAECIENVSSPAGDVSRTEKTSVHFDVNSMQTETVEASTFTFRGMGADVSREAVIDYRQDPPIAINVKPEEQRILDTMTNVGEIGGERLPVRAATAIETPDTQSAKTGITETKNLKVTAHEQQRGEYFLGRWVALGLLTCAVVACLAVLVRRGRGKD